MVDGAERITDPSNPRGYREVCLTEAAWQRRREAVRVREGNRCQDCKRWVVAGEADHIRGRGAGKRDDHPKALRWLCSGCHWKRHCPKVVPRKRTLG